ncbi:MAG: hypothetical protein GY913_02195 [Proteobacteria bacterium]|nr:hypothetical protein [Pseudomonadota bacterium]MCP4915710.1 hypothetical protein [Pseudomonadota bacterium]
MWLLLSISCMEGPWDGLPEEEIAARAALRTTPIGVSGIVRGSDGQPLADARVTLRDDTLFTDASGAYAFSGVLRHNALMRVTADGHRDDVVALWLARPVSLGSLRVEPICLWTTERIRLAFVGDMIFGRRFLDLDEDFPEFTSIPDDDPDALITPSDPYEDTLGTFHWVEDYLDGHDLLSGNLESVVTDDPTTPHETKPYIFFTLPESADAMATWFDYANLGNNHVYDYLEQGVVDTMDHVDSTGMGWAGLGLDSEEAFLPWDFEVEGERYAMVSATSVAGGQYDVGFVATDVRGGAADLRDDVAVEDALRAVEVTGRAAIMQMHFGKEYSEGPSGYAETRLDVVSQGGAALIVGHHPHVAQGFGWHDGVLASHSLGNFVFDQDRVETMLGMSWEVELEDTVPTRSRARPVYLEDYRPRPVVGQLADRLLRRVGEASLPYEAIVVPVNGQALIVVDDEVAASSRTVTLAVQVNEDGVGVLDLRQELESGESVVYVRSQLEADGRLGRDQLVFGSFEDQDVDEDCLEASRWDLEGDSRFVCVMDPYAGLASLCSVRDAWNSEDSKSWFRNRVRLIGTGVGDPNRELTLVGYRHGIEAGRTSFHLTWVASEGDLTFGEEEVAVRAAGSYDWAPFFVDLDVPADEAPVTDGEFNPRAVKLIWQHSPPEQGRALAMIDELALVNWLEEFPLDAGLSVPAPGPQEFLRVEAEPGEVLVDVTFEKVAPVY